jgi:hypothetical protein
VQRLLAIVAVIEDKQFRFLVTVLGHGSFEAARAPNEESASEHWDTSNKTYAQVVHMLGEQLRNLP